MNKFGEWLWWLDREDPRFQATWWAKLAFAVLWLIGLLAWLLFGEFAARLILQ